MIQEGRVSHSTGGCRQRGVSLIEVMVGITVGLIISIAITSSIEAIGKQFRITDSAHNAAEGALIGLGAIDRDIRMAGAAAVNGSFESLCPSVNMYENGTIQDGTPLVQLFPALRITDGGATGSDTLDIMLSPPDAFSGVSVPVVKEQPTSASVLKVTEPRGLLKVGDLVLIAQPPPNAGKYPCTRIQVTGITGNCTDYTNGCNVNFGSSSIYNPSNPKSAYSKIESYGPGSVLIRAPSFNFSYTRYSVNCGSLLRHDATLAPSCTGAPSYRNSALAPDIVMLKAQYGIANAGSDAVSVWKTATTTTTDELQRVKAVRVALVARSKEADNTLVTGAAPVVFGGTLTLNLSGAPVPAGKTWQNFRYRVHETVVPMRNAAWNR